MKVEQGAEARVHYVLFSADNKARINFSIVEGNEEGNVQADAAAAAEFFGLERVKPNGSEAHRSGLSVFTAELLESTGFPEGVTVHDDLQMTTVTLDTDTTGDLVVLVNQHGNSLSVEDVPAEEE